MEFDPPASAAPVAGSRTNTHDSGSGLSSGSVSAAMTHHDKPQEKEGPPVSGPSTTGFLDTSGLPDPMPKHREEKKIPASVKKLETQKNPPIPAEAHVVPSKTYISILSGKMLKGKVGTSGITSSQGSGSFFNTGDNRVLRSIYKEDISSMSVSSLSFNPVKWVFSSCPSSHPILFGGEEGRNRAVVVIAVQNFPAILQFVENKCLAIIRLERDA